MTDHSSLGRRPYDRTDDHDILIELRTEVRNLIRRFDESMTERDRIQSDHAARIGKLESTGSRQEGRLEASLDDAKKTAQQSALAISIGVAAIQFIGGGGLDHLVKALGK